MCPQQKTEETMNLKSIVAAVALGIIPITSFAQSPQCQKLLDDWEGSEKEKSYIHWGGVADNSAPRATIRAVEINSELITQSIILQQMITLKCSPPTSAPKTQRYWKNASECHLAKGEAEIRDKCSRAKWRAE